MIVCLMAGLPGESTRSRNNGGSQKYQETVLKTKKNNSVKQICIKNIMTDIEKFSVHSRHRSMHIKAFGTK